MGAASQGCGVQGEGETASEAVRDDDVAAGEETRRHEAHGGARGRPARRPPRRAQTQGCEGVAVCRDSGVSTEARRREVDSPRLSPGEGCEPQRPGLGPRGSSEAGEVGAVCGLRVGREGWIDALGFTPQRAQRDPCAAERSIPGFWQGRVPVRGTRRFPWRKDAHEALPTCCPPVRTRRDGHGIGAREPVGPG